MNMKITSEIAKEYGWYISVAQAAKLLNCGRYKAGLILQEAGVAFRWVGRTKRFLLPDVLEAIEKTKWRSEPTVARRGA
jgi:hypothetical protein